MKIFLKIFPINSAVIIGNMFLAHGLFWLFIVAVELLPNDGISFDIAEYLILFILYTLQILINILLYKLLLKKIYSSPEQKSLPLYLLLPIIAVVIWILVYKLLLAVGYEFDFGTYFELLVSFLPLILPTLILVSIVYNLFLKKYVGEVYYVYILSVLCIITVPLAFFTVVPML